MVRDDIKSSIEQAMAMAQANGALPTIDWPLVEVLRPKQADHGDYSTNIAMVTAAAVRKAGSNVNSRAIAQAIADHLPADGPVGSVEIAGPGFINIFLSDDWLRRQVPKIVEAGSNFGNIDLGHGQRWQVEYMSANPTGPLHYGGARNAALGDALANVLEAAGYAVQREFYVNDAGNQFNLFAATLYARYAQLFGRDESLPDDGYAGDYMIDYAQKLADEYGDRFLSMEKHAALTELKVLGEEIVLTALQEQLDKLGVHFDRWFREQSLYDSGLVGTVLGKLRDQGDLGERDGAVWFLASHYPKVDKDEVVIRSNGMPTYFASDIAYHYEKFAVRNFDHVVNVWGVDHQGHVPRMAAVMTALGLDPNRLTIVLHGLVKLIRDGSEVKLSKRRGTIITLGEVVDEVGADATRFSLLSRGPEIPIEFDLNLAVAESASNPVFYAQYSHARICSIRVMAPQKGITPDFSNVTLELLTDPSELALIRKLLELEEQIEAAISKLSPHNLTFYSLELARSFNTFYRDCKVLAPDVPERSNARMYLCEATRIGLSKTLSLLGVSAPESMHVEVEL